MHLNSFVWTRCNLVSYPHDDCSAYRSTLASEYNVIKTLVGLVV